MTYFTIGLLLCVIVGQFVLLLHLASGVGRLEHALHVVLRQLHEVLDEASLAQKYCRCILAELPGRGRR